MAVEFKMQDYREAVKERAKTPFGSEAEKLAEMKSMFILGSMLFNPETEVAAELEILDNLDTIDEFDGRESAEYRFLAWLLYMKDSEE